MADRFTLRVILSRDIEIFLPRAVLALLLGMLFSIAFIVTPYWSLTRSLLPSLSILLLTVIAGLAWSMHSVSDLDLTISRRDLFLYILLAIILFALNYRQLTVGIPAGGDESHHFYTTLGLVSIKKTYFLILALFAIPAFMSVFYKRVRWSIYLLGLIMLWIVTANLYWEPIEVVSPDRLLRYPFVSYWLIAFLPNIAALFTNPYHEILYRIIPFISVVSIAWLFQRELPSENMAYRLAWSLAIGSMPIVLFYSSILYLELPAIFLMTHVCFRIKRLMTDDAAQLKWNPAWYSLIFIGFLKETTLPFLAVFLALRWFIQIKKIIIKSEEKLLPIENKDTKNPIDPRKTIWMELGISFAVLLPLFLYLFFRSYYSISRTYTISLGNLMDIQAYRTLLHSLIEQYGLFLLLFIIGCALLIIEKEYIQVSMLLLIFIAYPLFYLTDKDSYPFIRFGYSRFNLYLVPSILAATLPLLARLIQLKPKIGALILASLVLTNLALSPINIDGTKTLSWYFTEHDYPYPQAFRWLKDNYPDKKILFAGLRSPYFFNFYFEKYGWTPSYEILEARKDMDDSEELMRLYSSINKCKQCMVVFALQGNEVPPAKKMSNLKQKMVLQNKAHTLVIYRVISP